MRISVKSRYGLSAVICLSQNYLSGECTTIIMLAAKLKISKIYLEQVFSLLKRAKLVISTKGAQGGYRLARMPKDITVYDILRATESALFEKTDATVSESAELIENTMQNLIFNKLDTEVSKLLRSITLEDLVNDVESQSSDDGYMYYL